MALSEKKGNADLVKSRAFIAQISHLWRLRYYNRTVAAGANELASQASTAM
jgi:hypothetical protein